MATDKPLFFDIHTHLNLPEFEADWKEVGERALNAGVWFINIGTNLEDSKLAIEIARELGPGAWATVGLHPTDHESEIDWQKFKDLASQSEVVAIGECGLDYFRTKEPEAKEKQKQTFRRQIEIAIELDKPLMIHCRDAYNEVAALLREYKDKAGGRLRGNLHFFAGNTETVRTFLDLGFSFSFTGVVTFASQYDELVRLIPLESLMVETDAPYVAPLPYRGQRNEPVYVREIAQRITELRGEEPSRVLETMTGNALKLFLRA